MYTTLYDNTNMWYDSLNDAHNGTLDNNGLMPVSSTQSRWHRYVYTYIGAINEFEEYHDYE